MNESLLSVIQQGSPHEKENIWWEAIIDKYLGSAEFVPIVATIYNYHIEILFSPDAFYLLYL